MKKSFLFLCLVLNLSLFGHAQDSCTQRISLLTCAPGTELYSTFGHTAIRVKNASGLDEVYNYGTFDGYDEEFYSKFVRGKLLYALAVQDFAEFMYQYREESRSVQEQELNLSCLQKQQLYAALQQNALHQNKDYRYDFLFDNCTTRARDMVANKSGGPVKLNDILGSTRPTFRQLIYIYLNRAHQDWSKLGIDLLLGAKMDRQATNEEAMFLPDNLLTAFDKATINGTALVKDKRTILAMPVLQNNSLPVTPGLAFNLFLLLVVILTFIKSHWAQVTVGIIDFLLFFSLGLTGLLLVFMWAGTDHALCANNYNLLWAVPTHVVAAFLVHKNSRRVKHYFKLVFALTVLLLLLWAFLPQHLNPAFLPLVLAIGVRSFVLFKKK